MRNSRYAAAEGRGSHIKSTGKSPSEQLQLIEIRENTRVCSEKFHGDAERTESIQES